jgi:hypothetical protein
VIGRILPGGPDSSAQVSLECSAHQHDRGRGKRLVSTGRARVGVLEPATSLVSAPGPAQGAAESNGRLVRVRMVAEYNGQRARARTVAASNSGPTAIGGPIVDRMATVDPIVDLMATVDPMVGPTDSPIEDPIVDQMAIAGTILPTDRSLAAKIVLGATERDRAATGGRSGMNLATVDDAQIAILISAIAK